MSSKFNQICINFVFSLSLPFRSDSFPSASNPLYFSFVVLPMLIAQAIVSDLLLSPLIIFMIVYKKGSGAMHQ
jgi:hypothetical protein